MFLLARIRGEMAIRERTCLAPYILDSIQDQDFTLKKSKRHAINKNTYFQVRPYYGVTMWNTSEPHLNHLKVAPKEAVDR